MKSTLRSKIAAAAMLLVPVGAMLAVTPASAEHRDGYSDRGHGYGYDRDNFRRDNRAPRIFDVTPDHGEQVSERGWTRISARFFDRGTGVADVSLRVDGRDVTGRARVDGDDIRYAENLRPGRHFAELVVRDHAGNASRRTWVFDVANDVRRDGYGRGYGRDGYYGPAVYGQPQRW
jgi:hypothetical protein